jgi:NhaP-type Na+/H+ or K+/H+ antiporter
MTPLVVPVWGVQAGVLTTWVVYNITVGTGTLAGSGIELLGTAVGSLALGPVAGIACQAISRQAKHHVIHASETTALIAGSVAGLGVTAGLTVGRCSVWKALLLRIIYLNYRSNRSNSKNSKSRKL